MRGLIELDTEVALVLPRRSAVTAIDNLRIIPAAEVGRAARGRRGRGRTALRVRRITTPLRPYMTAPFDERRRFEARPGRRAGNYGPDLPREVLRYAAAAGRIARRESFDVIHAHDWLTFLAGVEARRVSGKPLVLHVHATEFDRRAAARTASWRRSSAWAWPRPTASWPCRATRPRSSRRDTECRPSACASCTTRSTRAIR